MQMRIEWEKRIEENNLTITIVIKIKIITLQWPPMLKKLVPIYA